MVYCHKCGSKEWNSDLESKFCLQCGEPLINKSELYEFRKWFKAQHAEKERLHLVKVAQRYMPKPKEGTTFSDSHVNDQNQTMSIATNLLASHL